MPASIIFALNVTMIKNTIDGHQYPPLGGICCLGITFLSLDMCLISRPCLVTRNSFFAIAASWPWIHSTLSSPGPYFVVRSHPECAVGTHSLWESSTKMELYPVLDLQDSAQLWKDVSVSKCIFHIVTNAQHSLSSAKQEGRDTISSQACMAAYLSFVTIFNTVYQRKTHFQNPILSY